ncbi:MAG: aminopeptidase [Gaiellaceae bacterium]
MPDPRHERLAQVLVDYSTRVGEGDLVLLESTALGAPLLRALFRRVLEAGGHPQLRIGLEGAAETLLTSGSDEQLAWISPLRVEDFERADARIAVEAESNTRNLSEVDPSRQADMALARVRLRDRYMERLAAGEIRGVITAYPTNASAQNAEMSLAQYEDFVYRAALLDEEDPIGAWEALGERLRGIAAWLGTKREIRVVVDGTDLTVGVEGRTWIPCDGKENFPDGEIFTGPVETAVDGRVQFSFPAPFAGRLVREIDLRFEGGEVVEAHAAEGEAFLREMLAMDEGARRLGEFAFGMNDAVQEFTGHTLFDEKLGGTVHMALGKSYPESGGKNQSALHWDLVCDLRHESEVYADGELVYRNGAFLPDLV